MTKREVFEAIIAGANASTLTIEGMKSEEVVAFFENEIVNLDKRAERSRATSAKKRAEGDALKELVKSLLTEEFQTIADVVAQIEGEDVTASKVTYRLNSLAAEGYAEKADVQIPASAEGAKARVVKAYRIAD